MKLPAVAIAAAFLCGIVLGLGPSWKTFSWANFGSGAKSLLRPLRAWNTRQPRRTFASSTKRGADLRWDGVEGGIFWPEISSSDVAPAAKNNDSLVLRLHYGDRTMLLPGDAEKEAEHEMLAQSGGSELRADVLKVGHHGSKNSTTDDFLAAVQPQVAIISAGEDNPYGHPSRELLQRLENAGVRVLRVLRTDRDGAIHVLTDGHTLEISCFAGRALPAGDALRQAQAPNHDKNNEHQ